MSVTIIIKGLMFDKKTITIDENVPIRKQQAFLNAFPYATSERHYLICRDNAKKYFLDKTCQEQGIKNSMFFEILL